MAIIGQNACHAWGQTNANGSLYDSYNLSSVTDQGTGDMQFNFTTNFNSQYDYAAVGTGRAETSGYGNAATVQVKYGTAPQANYCRMTNTYQDDNNNGVYHKDTSHFSFLGVGGDV